MVDAAGTSGHARSRNRRPHKPSSAERHEHVIERDSACQPCCGRRSEHGSAGGTTRTPGVSRGRAHARAGAAAPRGRSPPCDEQRRVVFIGPSTTMATREHQWSPRGGGVVAIGGRRRRGAGLGQNAEGGLRGEQRVERAPAAGVRTRTRSEFPVSGAASSFALAEAGLRPGARRGALRSSPRGGPRKGPRPCARAILQLAEKRARPTRGRVGDLRRARLGGQDVPSRKCACACAGPGSVSSSESPRQALSDPRRGARPRRLTGDEGADRVESLATVSPGGTGVHNSRIPRLSRERASRRREGRAAGAYASASREIGSRSGVDRPLRRRRRPIRRMSSTGRESRGATAASPSVAISQSATPPVHNRPRGRRERCRPVVHVHDRCGPSRAVIAQAILQ